MNCHYIDKNGLVINTVVGSSTDVPPEGLTVLMADGGGPGDTWDGTQFIKPVPVLTKDQQNSVVISEINALEAKQPRLLREIALGDSAATAKLKAIDDQIVLLRGKFIK